MTICSDLGRCAYAVADEVHGDGSTEEGCPWWADCFGIVVPDEKSLTGRNVTSHAKKED